MWTLGEICAGIGAFSVGAIGLPIKTLWHIEKDLRAQELLKKRFPETDIYGDIYDIDPKELKYVDIITAGIPCQPFSLAGRRMGLNDSRWIWPRVFEVIEYIHPSWVILENTPDFKEMGYDAVKADLESCGYQVQAGIIPAISVRLPHIRERILIIAHSPGQRRLGLYS